MISVLAGLADSFDAAGEFDVADQIDRIMAEAAAKPRKLTDPTDGPYLTTMQKIKTILGAEAAYLFDVLASAGGNTSPSGWSVKELVERTGIARATAVNLLGLLEYYGLVASPRKGVFALHPQYGRATLKPEYVEKPKPEIGDPNYSPPNSGVGDSRWEKYWDRKRTSLSPVRDPRSNEQLDFED